jgi:hypothetical protein
VRDDLDLEAAADAGQEGQEEAAVGGYLVFFARDPVDDALAQGILDRIRTCPGAGWFDDPGAGSPAERTTGGYVKVAGPDEPLALALRDVARLVSAELELLVELQFREQVLGHLDRGTWRAPR